ncbi:hypothetical protein O181_078991 [Austropuccinia psidii MF-1]|uniref:Uncharacterized protein n=1 Tax=Austropuccinia psidii MF-1 TaxID=1389203 RepID=A0A9Q3IDJ7_9BASI|nr:hypothetical protein [Austropuccinia psidii MF-1]
MNLGSHSTSATNHPSPSLPSDLNKLFNIQANHIRYLEEQVNACDQELEGLLSQVANLNIQNEALTSSAKTKEKEKKNTLSTKKSFNKTNQPISSKASGFLKKHSIKEIRKNILQKSAKPPSANH